MSEIVSYMESLRENGSYNFSADIGRAFNRSMTRFHLEKLYAEQKDKGEFHAKVLSQICWILVEEKDWFENRGLVPEGYPTKYVKDIGRVEGAGLLFFPDYFVIKSWNTCEYTRIFYGSHNPLPVIMFRELEDYDGATTFLYYGGEQLYPFRSTALAVAFHRKWFFR
ncbi:hypothetical protein PQX77_018347 [Marasmius sp. AFHP31]|nr:hypothetical protein PQX77_018347 [Marasmius sp. AFHP31]